MKNWNLTIFLLPTNRNFIKVLPLFFLAQSWFPPVAHPLRNETTGHAFELSEARICLVFEVIEDFSSNPFRGRSFFSCQKKDSELFLPPRELLSDFSADKTYVANPRVVRIQKRNWIYLNSFDGKDSSWLRIEFSEQNADPAIEQISPPLSLQGQSRAWQQPFVSPDHEIFLVFEAQENGINQIYLSKSQDHEGLHFQKAKVLKSGAQFVRGTFSVDDYLAITYQMGTGSQMQAFLLLSEDSGQSFSEPQSISNQKNIHDAFPLARRDEGFDFYYLVWQPGEGFALFRRAFVDSEWGPEERLSPMGIFVQKPHALRLSDGRIFLTADWIQAYEDSLHSDLLATYLQTDAPLPILKIKSQTK